MRKIINSKKSKLTKKQYFMLLGAMIASLSITTPIMAVNALAADEEVLFEDEEDDYTTEDIKEDDIVEDNTVVEPEKQEEQKEEPKQEEQKQEETKEEEKKNDGGSCVTPENGYNEEEGKYWDPNIKTESEKKGLEEEPTPTPEPTPEPKPEPKPEPTPQPTPQPNPQPNPQPVPTQPQPTPQPVQPAVTPAPVATPKTGDLSVGEILGLLAGFGLGAYGIASLSTKIQESLEDKKNNKGRTR